MGFEAFCFALYERPELWPTFSPSWPTGRAHLRRLASYEIVKAFWFSDDIAYRTGFLVSPAVYRQHRSLAQADGRYLRKARLPFLYHSDGVLWEVLDDLVDCGVCALHPSSQSPWTCVRSSAATATAVLVGNVEVDTLSRGTPEQVREEVRALLREVAPGVATAWARATPCLTMRG